MERSLFVSDIHIKSPADPKYQAFLRFLDTILTDPPRRLFLLGDIFDLWISDRRFFIERYKELLTRIATLRDRGVEIHYFEGNHDLDLRKYWVEHLGVKIHRVACQFVISGRKVRVEHGDQMDPQDRGYLFLRWLLRTPVVLFLARTLPDRLVRWIGERASRASREYTTKVKTASESQAVAKQMEHAIRVYKQKPFDLFIAGHTHVFFDQTCASDDGEARVFRCINLGTWLSEPLDPMYLQLSDAGCEWKKVMR